MRLFFQQSSLFHRPQRNKTVNSQTVIVETWLNFRLYLYKKITYENVTIIFLQRTEYWLRNTECLGDIACFLPILPLTLHIQRQITSNTRRTQGHKQVWQVDRCIVVKPDQDAGAMAVRTPRESGVISDSRSKYSFLGGGGLDRARETTSPELGTGKGLVISPVYLSICLSVLSLKVFGCRNWLQPGKMCSKR